MYREKTSKRKKQEERKRKAINGVNGKNGEKRLEGDVEKGGAPQLPQANYRTIYLEAK